MACRQQTQSRLVCPATVTREDSCDADDDGKPQALGIMADPSLETGNAQAPSSGQHQQPQQLLVIMRRLQALGSKMGLLSAALPASEAHADRQLGLLKSVIDCTKSAADILRSGAAWRPVSPLVQPHPQVRG